MAGYRRRREAEGYTFPVHFNWLINGREQRFLPPVTNPGPSFAAAASSTPPAYVPLAGNQSVPFVLRYSRGPFAPRA